MRLLLKLALKNSRHFILLFITLIALLLFTLASNLEILALGVITKTGSDFFALFGSGKSAVSLLDVQTKWPEIAKGSEAISQSLANSYLSEKGGLTLVSRLSLFLESHFHILEDLRRLAFFIVLVALFKSGALFLQRYFTQLVSIRVSRDLRQRYFEHIQSLPMSFYHGETTGSLSSKVFGDAGTIANAISSLLLNYFQAPFAAITTLSACFFISWKLSLIIFIGFPLVLFPIIYIAKKIKMVAKAMQKNQENFASVLIDFLSGIQTVKVFAMEEFSLKKYRERNYEMAKLEERSARFGLASRPILHTVSSLFFATVILAGLYLFHMGPSDLLVFCGLLYVFYEPIKKFAEENNNIYRGIAAAERMNEVIEQKSTIVDRPSAKPLSEFRDSITFQDVYFRYKEEWVLKNFSMKVRKGEMVALVGPTGAGKSTIAQLLPRLYDIEKGAITLDGRPLEQFTINSLRENIAFVPQKPFLFLDTISQNIAFGRNFSRESIVRAAKRAHADEFIRELEKGYDTYLQESGKNLSGGQQQRIAIARALVKGAPILILDEATSSLDAISESKIKEVLEDLRGEITQIVIAHRLSTIEQADRIIYLEKGEKIAEGTKDQLLATCPNFRHMWELMMLEKVP